MILLVHETNTDSTVATSSAKVAGESHPPRRYKQNGHFLEITGPAHVIAHDADEICKIPGYRLATPTETDDYIASKNKKTSIREGR